MNGDTVFQNPAFLFARIDLICPTAGGYIELFAAERMLGFRLVPFAFFVVGVGDSCSGEHVIWNSYQILFPIGIDSRQDEIWLGDSAYLAPILAVSSPSFRRSGVKSAGSN